MSHFSADTRRLLSAGQFQFSYFALDAVRATSDIARLPRTIKILLENQLRHRDTGHVTDEALHALINYSKDSVGTEIGFWPSRVLMQEAAGLPGMLDLASMRDLLRASGRDPRIINPRIPVDLVIDHSIMVDNYGNSGAAQKNLDLEYERNRERYVFLKWAQDSFSNFRVVPPGQGICHQINIEFLTSVVSRTDSESETVLYPDTVIGTDSHTTMVNGLAVLGWGVGAIEAEAAMMGQPLSMLIPQVIGVEVTGALPAGATVTDAVLTLTEMLRQYGVVERFVEFFGAGLAHLSLADRATLANMAPDYGATCAFFPVDDETLRYLRNTGRDEAHIAAVEAYARAQGLWHDASMPAPVFSETLVFDLSAVEPSVSGPGRPDQRIPLANVARRFREHSGIEDQPAQTLSNTPADGAIAIAAITSCTNTSNPSAMIGAALLARNAVKRGLKTKPWVKTSMSPGSRVVIDYLRAAGLEQPLQTLGFDTVGFGCMTCVGNSGPLADEITRLIETTKLTTVSVLSGNRNFEARIHRLIKANFLCSPALVVAYALAGNINIDLTRDPIGIAADGTNVFLRDIWPSTEDIETAIRQTISREMFLSSYRNVFDGDDRWQSLPITRGDCFAWDDDSLYIRKPPFVDGDHLTSGLKDIHGARVLAVLGDQTTTDHISPVGEISQNSPAGQFLKSRGIAARDFNSYSSRRANHDVMARGTFANPRLQNAMVPGVDGPYSRIHPDPGPRFLFDCATTLKEQGTASVVFAGRQYGTGSARDWAARGPSLLGIKAVIAESFERIHRSNLALMAVLPLQLPAGVTFRDLAIAGDETVDILGLSEDMQTPQTITLRITRPDGTSREQPVLCRLDTSIEKAYFRAGGVLRFVFDQAAKQSP